MTASVWPRSDSMTAATRCSTARRSSNGVLAHHAAASTARRTTMSMPSTVSMIVIGSTALASACSRCSAIHRRFAARVQSVSAELTNERVDAVDGRRSASRSCWRFDAVDDAATIDHRLLEALLLLDPRVAAG